ncbi:MAG: iron ABC transporter permease [Acidimicrobiaceae bacterium]|nr:iron ABC transporter permease [Acidimicrobiaceae bacterium]
MPKIPSVTLWVIMGLLLIIPVLAFLGQAIIPGLLGTPMDLTGLASFKHALAGSTLRGILDSLVVSVFSALLAAVAGIFLAILTKRTNVIAKKWWSMMIWILLLVPTYLVTEGWQRLFEPHGVLYNIGINTSGFYHIFFGPVGVIVVLSTSGTPFAYLAISSGLLGLGSEFEDAARVHGSGVLKTIRAVLPMIAPAIMSALAIVFAESMSDFGVASTLAAQANFPVATYSLFNAIDSFPLNFGVAAAIGWVLVAAAGIPILVQSKALRGRSYEVLSGRTRVPRLSVLSNKGQLLATATLTVFFAVALGVPAIGVISASLLSNFGANFSVHNLTLANYREVLHSPQLFAPLSLSTALSFLTATLAVALGIAVARAMTNRKAKTAAKLIDLVMLGSVALPGIVLAAGYIFFYNLPEMSLIGINLYGTTKLLALGYLAGALPSTARLLVGPVSQIQSNLKDAARVHGANGHVSWLKTQLPLLARPVLWAWLLTFAKTLLELPLSQLLYAPNLPPISVSINKLTAGYDFGGGTAMSVIALALAFGIFLLAVGLFRVLAPAGWQKVGEGLTTK